jgi:hypothetical protein
MFSLILNLYFKYKQKQQQLSKLEIFCCVWSPFIFLSHNFFADTCWDSRE